MSNFWVGIWIGAGTMGCLLLFLASVVDGARQRAFVESFSTLIKWMQTQESVNNYFERSIARIEESVSLITSPEKGLVKPEEGESFGGESERR